MKDEKLKEVIDKFLYAIGSAVTDLRYAEMLPILRALLDKDREEREDNDEITLHDQLACEKLKVEMLMKKVQPDTMEEMLVRLAGRATRTELAEEDSEWVLRQWIKDDEGNYTAVSLDIDPYSGPIAAVRAALEEKA